MWIRGMDGRSGRTWLLSDTPTTQVERYSGQVWRSEPMNLSFAQQMSKEDLEWRSGSINSRVGDVERSNLLSPRNFSALREPLYVLINHGVINVSKRLMTCEQGVAA